MRLIKVLLSLAFYFILYFFISPKIFQTKRPLRNYIPLLSFSSNYLCKDSHHSCRVKASYLPNVSEIPCSFCPYSCGLCVICPNNFHSWNTCCSNTSRRKFLINKAGSTFFDTPTAKKYLAYIFAWTDDSRRYAHTYGGIAISPQHVITGRSCGIYPENYTIYLERNTFESTLTLTPIKFIEKPRYSRAHDDDKNSTGLSDPLCTVTVKEIIPNEYIIPLTNILNPEGKIGHFVGLSSYGIIEGEREILIKKTTKEFMVQLGDIDYGSPLLISEGGRFVLQGINIGYGSWNKKGCGYFSNIGEELQWIQEVIKNESSS